MPGTSRSPLAPVLVLLAVSPALLASSPARSDTILEQHDFNLDQVRVVGFELPRRARVEVDAVGVLLAWSADLNAYAWILDTDSREPVWVMEERHTDRVRGEDFLRRAHETLDLESGRYELYTFASSQWRWGDGGVHILKLNGLRELFRGRGFHFDSDDRESDLRRSLDECSVRLSSGDVSKRDLREFEPDGELPGALVRHARLGDGEYGQDGFSLDRPMDLRIYALLEFPNDWDHPADYGWIVDAHTRQRVWEPDHRHTQDGGGAEKNRVFDGEVHLDRGDYVLCYGTDGSHSYAAFNAAPPHDPLNWGITILPARDADRSAFHVHEAPARGEPLVDMTRAGDGDVIEQLFRLARETTLQVCAVGEWSDGDHEFADRGWIQKAGSDEVVWEMTRRNTAHAGGAEKNRMFDGTVKLPAGDYVAYYVTDDSHSYRHWNADAPFDGAMWGMALYPAWGEEAGGFRALSEKDVESESGVLARIVRVGDRVRRHEEFALDRPARVHVYALGEGQDGEMCDYGYIVDKRNDDTVWEMTYRNTRYAGGARKNRVFDGEVMLDAGTYEVWYESDGSHSFAAWNASAPRDPMHWGITVSLGGRDRDRNRSEERDRDRSRQ